MVGEPRRDSALPLVAVTGSQQPYIFDLPHLLALPTGFEFRFRYRHKWVEDAVARTIASQPRSLSGREMVLLFHSQDSKRIIPVRRGVVVAAESLGPMIFVRFRVGEFVKINLDIASYSNRGPGPTSTAARELSELAERLLGAIASQAAPADLSQSLPPGWYLRTAQQSLEGSAWDRGEATTAWAKVAAVLQGERGLCGIPLFFLMGFQTEVGDVAPSCAVRNRFSPNREEIHGFSLVESERYRMRVLEWCEPPRNATQPAVRVNCEFNPEHMALEGSSNLVVGRYDVVEFTFSALQPGYSEVALRAEPSAQNRAEQTSVVAEVGGQRGAGVAAWSEWPAIFVARVPIVVKPKARRLLLPVASVIVGLGIYLGVAPEFTERWRSMFEIGAIGLLLFGYGPIERHLERFFGLSSGLEKLKGGPKEWVRPGND